MDWGKGNLKNVVIVYVWGRLSFFNLFFETFPTVHEKRKKLKFFSFVLKELFLEKNFFKKNKKSY